MDINRTYDSLTAPLLQIEEMEVHLLGLKTLVLEHQINRRRMLEESDLLEDEIASIDRYSEIRIGSAFHRYAENVCRLARRAGSRFAGE